MRKLYTYIIIAALLAGCVKSPSTTTPTATLPTAAATGTTAATTAVNVATSTLTASPTLPATGAATAAATQPPPPTATAAATALPTASPLPSATTAPANTPTLPETSAPPVTGYPAQASTLVGPSPTPGGGIASLEHIFWIVFENRNYSEVIGKPELKNFNRLAQEHVLFTRFFAVAHPSLPNYLALTGGSTFGIQSDCTTCFIDAPNLADRLEAAGKTWKTYQEDMPSACSLAHTSDYTLHHNPWLYFDSIREDAERCRRSVVPLSQLDADLQNNQLPNFAHIMPNLCHSAHDCNLSKADEWLGAMVSRLQSSPALGQNYAIFITFDEASSTNTSCCGVPVPAGGRIVTILISPLAKPAFQDDSPLNHYSLLKTILLAWNLPGLGYTEKPETPLITAPWR